MFFSRFSISPFIKEHKTRTSKEKRRSSRKGNMILGFWFKTLTDSPILVVQLHSMILDATVMRSIPTIPLGWWSCVSEACRNWFQPISVEPIPSIILHVMEVAGTSRIGLPSCSSVFLWIIPTHFGLWKRPSPSHLGAKETKYKRWRGTSEKGRRRMR